MSVASRLRRLLLPVVAALALVVSGLATTGPARAADPTGDLRFKVERVAGADRWSTAAAVSREFFDPGVPAAFVTTGRAFPDAIAAGPAAAEVGAPVLFSQRTFLPNATIAELQRLRPQRIYLIGGTSALTEAVRTQLSGLTAGSVTRIGGADRWETAALVSRRFFPAGPETVYVATGRAYPDALTGGAAAGVMSAPMLLTDRGAVPPALAAELRRLDPDRILLLGGTAAVSDATAGALRSIATVERVAGATRYDTAVAISRRVFSSDRPTTFFATGRNFPDALAAVVPAGITRGPILLGIGNGLYPSTRGEIQRVSPRTAYLVGGPDVVGPEVAKHAQRIVGACWVGNKMTTSSTQVISQVSASPKQIAFTLDMGGRLEPARDIVAYLADNQVCTTFFIAGAMADTAEGRRVMADIGKHPELFEVANHTWHHCDLVSGGGGSPSAAPCRRSMTSSFIRSELTSTDQVIRSGTGMSPRPYWRPPYGSHNSFVRQHAAAVGSTKTIMWSRDTIDWDPATTTSQIVSRTTSPRPSSGTIVLAHLGGYRTLDALPQVVSTLRADGYVFTTVSDMSD